MDKKIHIKLVTNVHIDTLNDGYHPHIKFGQFMVTNNTESSLYYNISKVTENINKMVFSKYIRPLTKWEKFKRWIRKRNIPTV